MSHNQTGFRKRVEGKVAIVTGAASGIGRATALGRTFPDLGVLLERAAGSTDMGNVSLSLPAIHPFIGINSLPAVNHQPEFTAHCIKAEADQALHDGAVAMAWTAIDIAQDEALRISVMGR